MIYDENLEILHKRYNGPIPESARLRALFAQVIAPGGKETDRYECARSGSMVLHYSAMSSALLKLIKTLGQNTVATMQRRYHKQELALLLKQRRSWKTYRQSLGNCPEVL